MARKIIRHYEDCRGIDLKASDLTRDPSFFKDLQNFTFSKGRAIRGRKGTQVVGQAGAFTCGHNYTYFNPTTGATVEEMLAFNDNAWKLASATFTITRTAGSTNWNWQMALDSATNTFKFTINQNNAVYSSIDVGTGLAEDKDVTAGGVYTVKQLTAAIEALANFSCTGPLKGARVNGAQNGVTTITVVTGHNLAVGDVFFFWDYATSKLVWRVVNATTATTIGFSGSIFSSVNVKDGQDLGPWGCPAASIAVSDAFSSTSTTQDVTFMYWTPVKFNSIPSYGPHPFDGSWVERSGQNWKPMSCVNAGNCCYIGSYSTDTNTSNPGPAGRIMKYDSNRVYLAGLPVGGVVVPTPSAGSTVYRYIVTYQQTDFVGNIFEGTPCSPVTTTGALSVSCVVPQVYTSTNYAAFNTAFATVNGNQSGAGTQTGLTVNTGHSLLAGDKVTIWDGVSSALVTRTLTATTLTTISWASTTAISVLDTEAISCGLVWNLYRTKANGINYYLVASRPNNSGTTSVTFVDNVADGSLGAQFDEPEIGFEHDVPPKANYLCVHQGALIAAGDNNNPNTIYWSDPAGLEYFPLASNSADIPSAVSGSITGIASDTEDRLAIFKQRGYYDAPGDFATGQFTIKAVREGDYGISSHASIAKVNGNLIGVGELGFIAVRDGDVINSFSHPTSPAIQGNRNLNLGQAFAINDFTRLQYRCFIPGIQNGAFSASYSKVFCMDYETDASIWIPWKFSTLTSPTGGFAIHSTSVNYMGSTDSYPTNFQLNREQSTNPGHFFRQVFTGTPAQNYADNHESIQYIFRATPEHLGHPQLDKVWLRLVIYSFYTDFDEFTPWTATIKTYRNFQETAEHTSSSITFSTIAEFEKKLNLLSGKAQALEIYFTVNTIGQCPHISGYEVFLDDPYQEDDVRS